jgi:hypothetical protein
MKNLKWVWLVFTMIFAAWAGTGAHAQTFSNFYNWTTLESTNAPANGLFQFSDSQGALPNAFYRLLWDGN